MNRRYSKRTEAVVYIISGGMCVLIPLACVAFYVASTGVHVQSGAETVLYTVVVWGAISGCVTIPMGLWLAICGLVKLVRDDPEAES